MKKNIAFLTLVFCFALNAEEAAQPAPPETSPAPQAQTEAQPTAAPATSAENPAATKEATAPTEATAKPEAEKPAEDQAKAEPEPPPAAPKRVETVDDIVINLVDAHGDVVTSHAITKGPAVEGQDRGDFSFKPRIPKGYKKYKVWALEVRDPKSGQLQRLGGDSIVPLIIQWDGSFPDESTAQPNRQYFYRMVLAFEDRVAITPWKVLSTYTSTSTNSQVAGAVNNSGKLEFASSGGTHAVLVSTGKYRSVLFPNLFGDVRLVFNDSHSLGISFDATSNILFYSSPTRTGFFYSDYSLFYRYRLMGTHPRQPLPSLIPPYASSRYSRPSSRESNGSTSMELGVRVYQTILRGFGNEPIDGDLARAFAGVAVQLSASQPIGPVRFHALGEVGQSVLHGGITSINLEAAITYERFATVSPGLHFRFTQLSGTPETDPYDGAPISGRLGPIENQMLFIGGVLNFKL